jgi:hypothetical protein
VVLKDEIKANRLPAEQNTEANELVQNGKALFEAGRIQDAEARFNDVIKLDPLNKAGSYYLDEIRDQRHREENVVREEKAKDRNSPFCINWGEPKSPVARRSLA